MKIDSKRVFIGNILKTDWDKKFIVRSNQIFVKFADYYVPLFVIKSDLDYLKLKSRVVKSNYDKREVGIYNLDKKFLSKRPCELYNEKTGHYEYFPYFVDIKEQLNLGSEKVSLKDLREIQQKQEQVEDLTENFEEVINY